MNYEEYGGYLPLELPRKKKEYFYKKNELDVLRVNSGRSAFFYSVKFQKIKTIYLPYFNCIETKDPFEANRVKIKYYNLDENLLPKDIFLKKNEFLLWTNYYGNASEDEIKYITSNFNNIIIDNCNAFFSKPIKKAYNLKHLPTISGKVLNLGEGDVGLNKHPDHFSMRWEVLQECLS